MAGDIEAFLKMAAERRRQAMQAEGKTPPPPQQAPPPTQPPARHQSSPPTARPAPPPPRSTYQQAPQRPVSRPVRQQSADVELVEVEAVEEVDDYYAQADADYHLVSSEVSSQDIASHAEQLDDGWTESVTDDQAAVKKSSLAKELLEMLSEPQSVTKAILVSEILRRPDFD